MTFSQRVTDSSKSFCGYSNHHIYCHRYNDTLEWMPEIREGKFKPKGLQGGDTCKIRKDGFLNEGIDDQEAIEDS